MNQFSQTRAALIIEKNLGLMNHLCKNELDQISFIQNLCQSVILNNPNLDLGFIIWSFTNSSYFLVSEFTSWIEDTIYNGLIAGTTDRNPNYLSNYFGVSHEEIIRISNQNSDFNITKDKFLNDNASIGDLRNSLLHDISHILRKIQSKERVFSKVEIRESLVYYVLYLLEEYQKNFMGGLLPYSVITKVIQQLREVCKTLINLDFEEINPQYEIMNNIQSDHILIVMRKYMKYLSY